MNMHWTIFDFAYTVQYIFMYTYVWHYRFRIWIKKEYYIKNVESPRFHNRANFVTSLPNYAPRTFITLPWCTNFKFSWCTGARCGEYSKCEKIPSDFKMFFPSLAFCDSSSSCNKILPSFLVARWKL